ncbi:MAG: hypothetical protein J7L53_05820 [Deltaproteobacteria bacterium]|nr:hypothetical protein [Deltaproteobacteria bacterium]
MSNIYMLEKNLDDGSSIKLYTDTAIQYTDNTIALGEFEVYTSGGIYIKGEKAQYNIDQSKLEVFGPIIIKTQDGDKAYMDGLIWDRTSNIGGTDSPIKVEAKGIIIEAKNAQFRNDFHLLSFSGGVNAKIYNNYLGP